MRGLLSRSKRAVAVSLLIIVLLAPSALAANTTTDVSLWDQFVAWLAARIGVPGGLPAPDEDEGRIGVPNGVAAPEDQGRLDIPNG
jgi:hypothetical protein